MEKKALSSVPRPLLTEQNKEMLLLVPSMSYLVTGQRLSINGVDTLIMNFFHAEKKQLKPAFRTFCQMDDYITQDLTTEKTKWKTAAINYLTGYLYWYKSNGNIVMASVDDRKVIMKFLCEFKQKHNIRDKVRYGTKDTVVDTEVEDRIDEYQDQIKEWKLARKHQKEMDEIDQQMMKFGGLPDDYDSFVRNRVFDKENYIFYSTNKGRAYCTSCEKEFILTKDKHLRHKTIGVWNNRDKVHHNHTVACPFCNKFLECKSEGMSRQSLFSVQWSVLVQKHNEEVLVRYFCHTKDFRVDYHKPKIETFERYRTVHTASMAKDYEWARFKTTDKYRWCIYKERSYGWSTPAETVAPRSAVVYNTDLLADVAGTCMKYSAIDIYLNKIINNNGLLSGPWSIDHYFNSYRKKPYLEQLLKVGFYRIAENVLESYSAPKFKQGRSILETLEVTKTQFNMLRKVGDPSIRDMDILKYGQNLSQKEFEILRYIEDNTYARWYEKYIDMRKYTTIYKLDKYLRKTGTKQNDYFDYVGWLEKLGYDLRNESNLYPKDFMKAHDVKSKEHQKMLDKKAKAATAQFSRLLSKLRKETSEEDAMNLKLQGLFIRLPYKLDELKKEGETLHHCVGNYIDKVMKGETTIFFIRKIEEPDKPYYTLEWKGEEIMQCRGFKNCDMTPEVKAFTQIFKEKMLEKVRKEQKKTKLKTAS